MLNNAKKPLYKRMRWSLGDFHHVLYIAITKATKYEANSLIQKCARGV